MVHHYLMRLHSFDFGRAPPRKRHNCYLVAKNLTAGRNTRSKIMGVNRRSLDLLARAYVLLRCTIARNTVAAHKPVAMGGLLLIGLTTFLRRLLFTAAFNFP